MAGSHKFVFLVRGHVVLVAVAYTQESVTQVYCSSQTLFFSIYTLSDLGVLSNLIGSLSLANEHYSPPTE